MSIVKEGRESFIASPLGPVGSAQLSPSGLSVAFGESDPYVEPSSWTSIVGRGATLLPSVSPLLWVDEDALLVRNAREARELIMDRTGKVRATVEGRIRGVVGHAGPGRFHDGTSVFRASDGARIWTVKAGADPQPSATVRTAVAGGRFVFEQGTSVRFETIDAQNEAP